MSKFAVWDKAEIGYRYGVARHFNRCAGILSVINRLSLVYHCTYKTCKRAFYVCPWSAERSEKTVHLDTLLRTTLLSVYARQTSACLVNEWSMWCSDNVDMRSSSYDSITEARPWQRLSVLRRRVMLYFYYATDAVHVVVTSSYTREHSGSADLSQWRILYISGVRISLLTGLDKVQGPQGSRAPSNFADLKKPQNHKYNNDMYKSSISWHIK